MAFEEPTEHDVQDSVTGRTERRETDEHRQFRDAVLQKVSDELLDLNQTVSSINRDKFREGEALHLDIAHEEAEQGLRELIGDLSSTTSDPVQIRTWLEEDIIDCKAMLKKLGLGRISKLGAFFESSEKMHERLYRTETFRKGLVFAERKLTALNRAINSVSQ